MITFTVNTGVIPLLIPVYMDFINWRKLSEQLTGNPETIRSNRIPKKYQAAIQELKDLHEYWLKRNT